MCESFSSWLISNLGIFIIGTMFSEYYLGVYKTATTTVNQIISIVTASTIGVMISAFSNVQDDKDEFAKLYFGFLKGIGIITIPMGMGILIYDDLVCNILLGKQWNDATIVVGVWGFVLAESVIFNSMSGAVIISKGRPKELFLSNVSQAVLMLPAFYFGAKLGFEKMVILTSIIRVELPVVQTIIACKVSEISVVQIFDVIKKYVISTLGMSIIAIILLSVTKSIPIQILTVIICIAIYFAILYILPDGRKELNRYILALKNQSK